MSRPSFRKHIQGIASILTAFLPEGWKRVKFKGLPADPDALGYEISILDGDDAWMDTPDFPIDASFDLSDIIEALGEEIASVAGEPCESFLLILTSDGKSTMDISYPD